MTDSRRQRDMEKIQKEREFAKAVLQKHYNSSQTFFKCRWPQGTGQCGHVNRLTYMEVHIAEHMNFGRIRCSVCQRKFIDQLRFQEHTGNCRSSSALSMVLLPYHNHSEIDYYRGKNYFIQPAPPEKAREAQKKLSDRQKKGQNSRSTPCYNEEDEIPIAESQTDPIPNTMPSSSTAPLVGLEDLYNPSGVPTIYEKQPVHQPIRQHTQHHQDPRYTYAQVPPQSSFQQAQIPPQYHRHVPNAQYPPSTSMPPPPVYSQPVHPHLPQHQYQHAPPPTFAPHAPNPYDHIPNWIPQQRQEPQVDPMQTPTGRPAAPMTPHHHHDHRAPRVPEASTHQDLPPVPPLQVPNQRHEYEPPTFFQTDRSMDQGSSKRRQEEDYEHPPAKKQYAPRTGDPSSSQGFWKIAPTAGSSGAEAQSSETPTTSSRPQRSCSRNSRGAPSPTTSRPQRSSSRNARAPPPPPTTSRPSRTTTRAQEPAGPPMGTVSLRPEKPSRSRRRSTSVNYGRAQSPFKNVETREELAQSAKTAHSTNSENRGTARAYPGRTNRMAIDHEEEEKRQKAERMADIERAKIEKREKMAQKRLQNQKK